MTARQKKEIEALNREYREYTGTDAIEFIASNPDGYVRVGFTDITCKGWTEAYNHMANLLLTAQREAGLYDDLKENSREEST